MNYKYIGHKTGASEAVSGTTQNSNSELMLSPKDTNGRFSMVRQKWPKGEGSVLHFHTLECHAVIVTEGSFEFLVDGKELSLESGDILHINEKVPHSFSSTYSDSEMLIVICPPGLERLLLQAPNEADRPTSQTAGDFGIHLIVA